MPAGELTVALHSEHQLRGVLNYSHVSHAARKGVLCICIYALHFPRTFPFMGVYIFVCCAHARVCIVHA